jgi:hypothetical protein
LIHPLTAIGPMVPFARVPDLVVQPESWLELGNPEAETVCIDLAYQWPGGDCPIFTSGDDQRQSPPRVIAPSFEAWFVRLLHEGGRLYWFDPGFVPLGDPWGEHRRRAPVPPLPDRLRRLAARVLPLMRPGADDRTIAATLGIDRGDVEVLLRYLQHISEGGVGCRLIRRPGPEQEAMISAHHAPRRSRLALAAKVALALVLLALALYLNRRQIAQVFEREIDWRLYALGLALDVAGVLLAYGRWFLMVRALGLPFRRRDALRLGFIGTFFNVVIPGAIGGDFVKAAYLCREQPRKAPAIASVVIDRLASLLALFLLACGAGGAGLGAARSPAAAPGDGGGHRRRRGGRDHGRGVQPVAVPAPGPSFGPEETARAGPGRAGRDGRGVPAAARGRAAGRRAGDRDV